MAGWLSSDMSRTCHTILTSSTAGHGGQHELLCVALQAPFSQTNTLGPNEVAESARTLLAGFVIAILESYHRAITS